ncbi:solute carrier 16 [Mactra antiquata]
MVSNDSADDVHKEKEYESLNIVGVGLKQSNEERIDNLLEQCEHNKHSEEELPLNVDESVDLDEDIVENQEITYDTTNSAVDGGWGWCIVIGALLLRTVIGGIGRSHGLFYIKFKERFGGSATATALVTSLTAFIRLSGGPIVSILSGRFQIRILTSIGSVTLFLGLILTAFATSLQFLYFSYGIVTGIGRALSLTAVPILLGYYFDKRRSLAFGLASAGFSIGGFAITPIVELMFQHFGYQGTFIILSGFALNILVSSSLFRPIELHRKLIALNKKTTSRQADNVRTTLLSSCDSIKNNGDVLATRASRNDVTKNKNGGEGEVKALTPQSSTIIDVTHKGHEKQTKENHNEGVQGAEDIAAVNIKDTDYVMGIRTPGEDNRHYDKPTSNSEAINSSSLDRSDVLQNSDGPNLRDSNCRNVSGEKGKKKALISWSILKDSRFLCFVFATFCFTLPTSALFLPALAKSKGVSEIQAATLLSTGAGFDTVFRILSGIILDLRLFRTVRPQIYNGVTFIQGTLSALYPSMTSYEEFMVLTAADGAVQGIKAAQGSVIMMDMLGVDKFASSLAVTMTVQCVAVFLGPTISGRLIDSSGSYNGAFYFASSAILLGAVVMAGGNIAKHYRDSKRVSKDNHRNK